MDRVINYPGQVPLETDLLKTNQFTMIGLAKLAAAILGTATCVNGFATTQTVVPSMAVLVAPGEIYSLQNLEASAMSSLPQDLTHSILKQGISLDARSIAVAAPGTAGFSINYLIQASYQDSDSGSTVLPYYNASNPSVAYSGPANSGAAQPTSRAGVVVISAKAGAAATTGTQTTPAPDAGYVGLYVVTVANGASTVVNANISAYNLAPFVPAPFVKPMVRLTSSGSLVAPWYVTTMYLSGCGAGAGGGGGGAGGASSFTGAGGGSGAAGAHAIRVPLAVTPGATINVTIGAAGAGVGASAGSGSTGTAGGATVITGFNIGTITLAGGSPGQGGLQASNASSAGGTAGTGGNPTNAGQSGASGSKGSDVGSYANNVPGGNGATGASGPFGGGGGGGSGTSVTSGSQTGSPASGYGAGGGGGGGIWAQNGSAQTGGASGAGSPGLAIFEW